MKVINYYVINNKYSSVNYIVMDNMKSLSDEMCQGQRRRQSPKPITKVGDIIYEKIEREQVCIFIKVGIVRDEITGVSHWSPFRNIEIQSDEGVKYLYVGGSGFKNRDRYYK